MLIMGQKKAVTREAKDRYQKARKKEKGMMLDEFTRLTGYNRCYASQILKQTKLLGYATIAGQRMKYVSGQKTKRKKHKYYDHEVLTALNKIWKDCD